MTPEQYRQVKQIFLEAISIKPEERLAFIEEKCASQVAIGEEVKSLLLNHEERESLVPPRRNISKIKLVWSSLSQSSSSRRGLIVLLIATIAGLSLWTQYEVKRVVITATTEHLRGSLDAVVAAFEVWVESRIHMAERIGEEENVRELILGLVQTRSEPKGSPVSSVKFDEILRPMVRAGGFFSYSVMDREFRIVASSNQNWMGLRLQPSSAWLRAIVDVFVGKSVFMAPHRLSEGLELPGKTPESQRAVIQFAVPILDVQGKIQAAFVLTMEADSQYQRILASGRAGQTTEIYSFDDKGILLSQSRFENDLRAKGLLDHEQSSILNVQVRDSSQPQYPFTQLAQDALRLKDSTNNPIGGVLAVPYRDYRGSEVVGAWRWLPEFGMAIAAESDLSEVDLPLWYLKFSFAILLVLLTLSLSSTIYSAMTMLRLKREISERRRIGSYRIVKKLGEGGIGEVFLAHHDLLKRPTAIKILKHKVADAEAVLRFEREVQLTCCLTQPHIVTIYDFGRTSDGTFYYAMEYLRGIDLGHILHIEGHLPYGRGIYLLLQVCRALQDAHANGLLHRDIKPQNIMLTRLGSENDFVKVVDFGLVKEIGPQVPGEASQSEVIRGTPLYTAPERFRETGPGDDVRVDIYSLGATAYKIFSGRNHYSAATEAALLYAVLHEDPLPLISHCHDCPPALAELIMRCVSREPDLRPASVGVVLQELLSIQKQWPWTDVDSNPWWSLHPELLLDES